ncbi:MAG: energy transducer TonB [Desulfofustis sp.]|nr:energy transducer TonB [Desulfofustis sp.]
MKKIHSIVTKQYSVTYDGKNQWLLPLNLAIGFHLLIAFSIIFLPGMFKSKPRFEDIYSVDLISLADQPAPQPQAAAEPPPVEPVNPEPEAVSIAPETVAPAPKPVDPVSLKPLKKKIKKTVVPEENQEQNRQREAERLRRQRLAEALRAEQQAAEQARIAAEEAARAQKLLEQQLTEIRNQAQRSASSTARSGSASTLTILERQYYTAIVNRITQFWALPEFKRWDPSTQAVVVITISQNGTITNHFFEKRSNDPVFDQFVSKAVQDANPLPAIPPALRKNSFEIGLRFSPGSIN